MYGSQTGNAQSIAEGFHKSCKEKGFTSTLFACDGWKKVMIVVKVVHAYVGQCGGVLVADTAWRGVRVYQTSVWVSVCCFCSPAKIAILPAYLSTVRRR